MSVRVGWIVSWVIWTLAVALTLGGIVFSVLNRGAIGSGLVLDILLGIVLLGFVAVGVLVSSRRPGNPVGWIIMGAGTPFVLLGFAESYGVYAIFTDPGRLPGGEVMAWFAAWIYIPALFAAPAMLFLLFPDGRLIGRRWRVVFWLIVVSTLSATVDAALSPVLDDAPFKGVVSPLGLDIPASRLAPLSDFGWPGMVAGLLLAALAMITRLRRSRGIERQQLKWIASAAAFLPIVSSVGVISYYLGREQVGGAMTILAFLPVPLAAGFAIFRYRLYDIDRIINRTLVYGLLTAMLVLVYVGSVLSLQYVFRALAGDTSQLVIVASTLFIAALFNPLRQRLQAFIDRRFYRKKYDAQKALEAFSARLRDETNLEILGGDLVGVARETVQPTHASLWLRTTDREAR